MLIRISALFVVLSVTACRGRDARGSPADSAAVIAADEQYRQGWLHGDTAMALGVVSDDVRFMLPGAPDVRGQEGARVLFAQEMATYRIPALTIHRAELIVRGDHAIDIGTYEETLVPKTGATINAAGRYLVVWRREAGNWRIWRFMLNFPEPEGTGRAR